MTARAEIHWSGSAQDRRALAARVDWSRLEGLEGLWPELERRHGPQVALEAPHSRHPETLRYGELRQAIDRAAAAFAELGVGAGDVVALFAENGPRWLVADQGLMRAGAADAVRGSAAPAEELRYILEDAGAVGAVLESAALLERLALDGPALARLRFIVLLEGEAPAVPLPLPCLTWDDLLERGGSSPLPPVPTGGPGRLATLLYTSGTTGQPKGCMHTHRSTMSTLVGGVNWFGRNQDAVYLSVLPFFHVTGMAGSMNGPIYLGATMVILPRWDRDAAIACIERHRVTVLQVISTMLFDLLASPALDAERLRSLQGIRGGGAAMPAAVVARLKALTGLDYVEGYGMSETMAATHINPVHRPKPQCLGIPVFDVDARVVDPVTLENLAPGEVGEIIVHGPQLMRGYWQQPEATRAAFVEREGRRFLRTGDLARVDEDGYWFMVDRLKRMINAAGFKVWPAEVEALMYQHPAVQEACVIGVPDPRRGETVKALVVLKPDQVGIVSEQALIDWAHAHMAAYKSPRQIEFVPSLPRSGSGKVLWRELQERAVARITP